MRIQTNVSSLQGQLNLQKTNKAVQDSMGKLSSGFRITKSSDDAAGLAISNKLRAETRSLTAASRNVEQASSMLQVAEGAANSVQNILERMKELATQGSSSNNATEGAALNAEFTELKAEIDRIADSTNYRGTKLTDGSVASLTFQIGSKSAADSGGDDQLSITLSDLNVAALDAGLTGASVGTAAGADAALGVLDNALESLNTALGTYGATQNRLEYAQSNIKTSIQNLSSAESVIRDVDMAEEMSKFSKTQIMAQAGTAMLAQANQAGQGVLQLLRG